MPTSICLLSLSLLRCLFGSIYIIICTSSFSFFLVLLSIVTIDIYNTPHFVAGCAANSNMDVAPGVPQLSGFSTLRMI